jgi:CheY-like chemotaxis protein
MTAGEKANNLKSILLVDDDNSTLLINKMILKKAGLENLAINTANDGGEAMDYINSAFNGKAAENPVPDLIFLDINMPAIDGWDFLEDYRQLTPEQQNKTKIVMLTTSMNPDDEERALNTKEVDKFLRKPLTVEAIKEIVSEYFSS